MLSRKDGKILEIIVHSRMEYLMEQNRALFNSHYGLRRLTSAIYAAEIARDAVSIKRLKNGSGK